VVTLSWNTLSVPQRTPLNMMHPADFAALDRERGGEPVLERAAAADAGAATAS
jgi:hypothetical protein